MRRARPTDCVRDVAHFVDQNDIRDFSCAICWDVLNAEAVETRCHHVFCAPCLGSRAKCPTCRSRTGQQPISGAFLRLLYNKRVKCLFAECKWQGDYGREGRTLTDHVNGCAHRPWTCEHCRGVLVYAGRDQHLAICNLFPTPCRHGCGQTLPRSNEAMHAANCDRMVVPCAFQMVGCAARVSKRELAQHEEAPNFMQRHMTLLLDRLKYVEEANSCLAMRVRSLEQNLVTSAPSSGQKCDEVKAFNKSLVSERLDTGSTTILDALRQGDVTRCVWLQRNNLDKLDNYDSSQLLLAAWEHRAAVQYLRPRRLWSAEVLKSVILELPQDADWHRFARFVPGVNVSLQEICTECPFATLDCMERGLIPRKQALTYEFEDQQYPLWEAWLKINHSWADLPKGLAFLDTNGRTPTGETFLMAFLRAAPHLQVQISSTRTSRDGNFVLTAIPTAELSCLDSLINLVELRDEAGISALGVVRQQYLVDSDRPGNLGERAVAGELLSCVLARLKAAGSAKAAYNSAKDSTWPLWE